MSDSNSIDDKHSVVIDSADIHCPVTFQKYSEQNYPVTLPCGHTLSVEAFNMIRNRNRLCPNCRKEFAIDYIPQRNILWGNVANQIRTKARIYCHQHPQDKAVAICFEEKVFLCPDCLMEDKHPHDRKITLKKLNSYLEDKKQTLQKCYEKAQQSTLSQVKDVTGVILTKIEPCIHVMANKELSNYLIRLEHIEELMSRVDYITKNKLDIGSIKLIEELENEITKLENIESELQKNIDNMVKKIVALIQGGSLELNSKGKQNKNITKNQEKEYTGTAELNHLLQQREVEEKEKEIETYKNQQQTSTRKIQELQSKVNRFEQDQIKLKNQLMNKNTFMWVILIASLILNMGTSLKFFNWTSQASCQGPPQEPKAFEIETIERKFDQHFLNSLWIQLIPISAFVLFILQGRVCANSKLWIYIKIAIALTLASAEGILYSFKEDYQNIGHWTGKVSFIVHLTILAVNIWVGFAGLRNLIDDAAEFRDFFDFLYWRTETQKQRKFMFICCSYVTRIIISGLVSLLLSSGTTIYVIIQLSLSVAFLMMIHNDIKNFNNDILYIPGIVFLIINIALMGSLISSEMHAIIAKLSFVSFIFVDCNW